MNIINHIGLPETITKDLVIGIDETTRDLLKTISLFTQKQFNTAPYEGSWTAAQAAEHLLKSESGILKALTGSSRPTENHTTEKIEIIKSVFLDFNTKMKSPDFVLPSDEVKEKEMILHSLKTTKAEIRELIDSIDLSRTFTSFPLPKLGELTGWEWICFSYSHTKRHTWQMKNIYNMVS